MKPLKTDTNSHSPAHTAPPLNPQQFPLQAQMDATTGRDNVRKAAHVHVELVP